jgi:hypothetical protein
VVGACCWKEERQKVSGADGVRPARNPSHGKDPFLATHRATPSIYHLRDTDAV